MPINASNALTLAHQLRVYTAEAASFSDMMDVVYVAQMIQKFLGYVDQIKEVRDSISLLPPAPIPQAILPSSQASHTHQPWVLNTTAALSDDCPASLPPSLSWWR